MAFEQPLKATETSGLNTIFDGQAIANSSYASLLASSSISVYYFTYYYNSSSTSSDYYNGYVFAPTGNYTVGNYYDPYPYANEAGYNGRYYISAASSLSDSVSSYQGQVYVYSY